MVSRWYQEAVIYSVEVGVFQDSDGDGHGDLRGLISRLDYLARLGVTCLWLNPIHPSPWTGRRVRRQRLLRRRPEAGQPRRLRRAGAAGRANEACGSCSTSSSTTPPTSTPGSVPPAPTPTPPTATGTSGSTDEPPDRFQGTVFPGEQTETWTYEKQARAWYFHRFYDFQPDLNWSNPDVRREITKVMAFWLQLGASGFRIDAAPVRPGAGVARRGSRSAGLLHPRRLAAGHAVAARRLHPALRGQRRARRRS